MLLCFHFVPTPWLLFHSATPCVCSTYLITVIMYPYVVAYSMVCAHMPIVYKPRDPHWTSSSLVLLVFSLEDIWCSLLSYYFIHYILRDLCCDLGPNLYGLHGCFIRWQSKPSAVPSKIVKAYEAALPIYAMRALPSLIPSHRSSLSSFFFEVQCSSHPYA